MEREILFNILEEMKKISINLEGIDNRLKKIEKNTFISDLKKSNEIDETPMLDKRERNDEILNAYQKGLGVKSISRLCGLSHSQVSVILTEMIKEKNEVTAIEFNLSVYSLDFKGVIEGKRMFQGSIENQEIKFSLISNDSDKKSVETFLKTLRYIQIKDSKEVAVFDFFNDSKIVSIYFLGNPRATRRKKKVDIIMSKAFIELYTNKYYEDDGENILKMHY